jgi:hypothetical protein
MLEKLFVFIDNHHLERSMLLSDITCSRSINPDSCIHLVLCQILPLEIASSTTNPPAAPDPFDLGIHTPANLNRGARAALLQNSPAALNGPVGVSPGLRRTVQTPSSPLNAATTAAATEGAERTCPSSISEQQPVSIIESANGLARERIEEYNAKLAVFQGRINPQKRANKLS